MITKSKCTAKVVQTECNKNKCTWFIAEVQPFYLKVVSVNRQGNTSFWRFVIFSLFLQHDKKTATHIRSHHTIHNMDMPYSFFFSLYGNQSTPLYFPKNRSEMNRVGNTNAACRYRLRVCFSLYILYTKRRFIRSIHAG